MKRNSAVLRTLAGLAICASLAQSGTFGRVVSIGGHASDLALDEARGVLYVANFTANRIEVMNLADGAIQSSINVAAQPGSLAVSRDGRFLVVGHYGNFAAPGSPSNSLTVIDLNSRARQTFALGFPALGVAFGVDNRVLVVTSVDFTLFDPVSGSTQALDTIQGLIAKTLPVESATFPPNIVAASLGVSGDGRLIYGLTDTFRFRYDVEKRRLSVLYYTSEPPQGPRAVSVNEDGSSYLSGWALFGATGRLTAQFPDPSGLLNVGTHALDTGRGLIYAQVPRGSQNQSLVKPELQIVDADNLRVREILQLRENLAGKSVLTTDGSVMYAASDSGVTILPVGQLNRAPRIQSTVEDIIFRGNFCDRRVATQEIAIVNPGGPPTDFTLVSDTPGISFSPSSGVTPATIRVSVDPNAFQNVKGTLSANIHLRSSAAINIPASIRVLINNREPDQRGTVVNIPGHLVDMLPDPIRDRFYVLRQDTNEVLVFNGTTYTQIATLRTGNTPWSMAITFDRRYLIVGNDNSQIANLYDLETLETLAPITFPPGHYPRSIAASGNAILAASRVAGPVHKISRIDLLTRSAVELPTLGVYENDIALDTALTASPNGSSILVAQSDGTMLLYNANADTFTISRKDTSALAGAYAASSFDQYVVGNTLYNSSLVPVARLESGTGLSSGFAFLDQSGFRASAPNSSSPGVIQRVDLNSGAGIRPTRMVEAPVLGQPLTSGFTRSIAPLYSRAVIATLTTSGFTVLPWNYDAAVAPPVLQRVVNAADGSATMATGSLISIFGNNLSPVNMASSEMPLPTALGDSCLTVNGVPVPVLFVSPNQINAQVPFTVEGNVTMILRTPGGVSDNFNLVVFSSAPGVFRSTSGPISDVPAVVRASNNLLATLSNPLHRGDRIVIYLTGLGRTNPSVDAGVPSPGNPAAIALEPTTVTLGGTELAVDFVGLSPGQVGVYQINAVVGGFAPLGVEVPLVISQGGGSTTVAVRVVD